ncbi:tol-pal system protein YbgF [Desulfocurvibacter africanus PCS]|uniref:Tol-pal system protein YbgF n=1 Tax=Desulfocurvibacter africanus PCS TaxID=1262666 RepID=M5PX84_DESAF|nr:tol-pal system protein YbgF [Desulfocurvibacter africanus]EMG38927.1 tol-pal system protein YbgF [Desulfocurvibacter africanus PCS]
MKRIPCHIALLAGLSVLTITGCASQADVNLLQAQVQQQATQQRNVQQRVNDLETQLRQIQSQVQEVDKRLKSLLQLSTQNTSAQSAQANMWSEMESMRVQFAKLQGEMDTLVRENQLAEQQGLKPEAVHALMQEVEDMKTALQSQLAIDFEQLSKEEKAVKGDKGAQSSDPAQALYLRALDNFKKRNYMNAQSMWAEFVKAYPKHELVSNAIFWQGESFYQTGDFARAVLSYQDVITKYPKSNKIPAAMLKQGIAFKKIGKDKAGDLVLQELVKKYPKSAEAKRAKSFQ